MEVKKHILVVDDEDANIFMMEGILSNESYEVSVAKDGKECLEMLNIISKPNLILLDIMMPEISGIDVLKTLKKDDKLKDIPVIMISALTDAENIETALAIGAMEYIKKPVDEVELIARIETVLKLKKQEDELKEALKVKDDFIRMISHDLRTPFSTISGFAQILLEDKSLMKVLNNEHREILGFINESSYFVMGYFNKMLAWSNLGQRRLILDKENIKLIEIINNIELIFKQKAKKKNIKLKYDVLGFEIYADKTYLIHAISNLVSNAIKFTPRDGTISIFTTKNDKSIVLHISDTGGGIKQEKQTLLSEELTKSTLGTEGEKGTGTGIYICKRIIEAHGYKLDFITEIGKGTDFIIEF